MPTKKTTPAVETKPQNNPVEEQETKKSNLGKYLLIAAVVVILGFIVYRNRSMIIVATVNGQPIWRPAFEQKMIAQVGQRALDEMINEQIVLSEASKRGIVISAQDLSAKISEIEKTLPQGTTLQQALTSQGMTLDDFKRQISLQLMIEKMLSSSSSVSDAELAKYIEQNKQFLTATGEAELKEEARNALMSQRRNQDFQKLFQDLKAKAKVNKFL